MRLFIGAGLPEIMLIFIMLFVYGGLFMLAIYIVRKIFKVKKIEKHQEAQTALLLEMAKKQGVDESEIERIKSTLT